MDNVVDMRRNGSHIDSRCNRFALQSFHDAFGNVDGNADLRFYGRSTEVRRDDDIVHANEGIDVRRKRFRRKYVDGSAGNVTALQGISQGIDVEDGTARDVDDPHAIFHFGNFILTDKACRFLGQRRVHRNVVRPFEEGIQVDGFNAELFKPFFGNIRVIADGLHFHGLHPFCNPRADAADTDDAEGLILELNARKGLAVPVAGHQGIMSLRNVAGNGHNHGAGVFRRR